MTKAQLVNFETSDNLTLPGLLFEPEKKTKKVLIYLHGNGSSSVFYKTDLMNALAGSLTKIGFSFFPFNNRGANLIKKLDRKLPDGTEERVLYGMTYELIKDCILDIDGAVEYLSSHGYEEIYLIGSSTGANKICVYNWYKPQNKIKGYILLSGGDDTGLYYSQELGPKKYEKALVTCKKKIQEGKGMKLAMDFISYQSLYDTINPDGDYNTFPFYETLFHAKLSKKKLFQEFASIQKPTLVVYGEIDKYCYGKVPEIVELLKKKASKIENFTFHIIPDGDHSFEGKEKELVEVIAEWLCKIATFRHN